MRLIDPGVSKVVKLKMKTSKRINNKGLILSQKEKKKKEKFLKDKMYQYHT